METIVSAAVPGALILVGLALLARGWCGRRVGEHPCCRACGFNLSGVYPTRPMCPECGAALGGPAAVAIGERQRRWGMLVGGLLVLGLAGGTALPLVTQTHWQEVKPVWLLRFEATAGSSAAVAELARRADANTLTRPQVTALVGTALARQADRSRPWDTNWGEIVELSYRHGLVDPGDLDRYLYQAFDGGGLVLELRPRVQRSDPVPYRVTYRDIRAGSGRRFQWRWRAQELVIGEQVEPVNLQYGGHYLTSGGWKRQPGIWRYGDKTLPLSVERLAMLPGGEQTVTLTGHVTLWEAGRALAGRVAETRLPLTASFEVTDEQTVRPIADPSLRDAIRQAVRVRYVSASRWTRSERVSIYISISQLPSDVSFDVELYADGQQLATNGRLTGAAGAETQPRESRGFRLDVIHDKMDEVDRVEVVLVPNPAWAREMIEVSEIWNETIVIPDVPVRRR